ncbi:MAG: helix-turn-helix domain-containing protein, partial [Acidobacteriaceae bacterium]
MKVLQQLSSHSLLFCAFKRDILWKYPIWPRTRRTFRPRILTVLSQMLGVPLADSILECHPKSPDTSIRHTISGVEHETEAELTRNFPTNPDITGHFVQPAAHLIVEFRSRRRWSQERLAEKSGLSSRTIQRIERGESTHRTTIARLASALGVALDDCITTVAGLPSKDHIVSQLVNVRREVPPCPYKGLLAFREEDAEVFFGREVLVQRLKEKLLQSNMVQVSGCSGSGKSSLIAAGLVPALKRDDSWQVLYCRPGGDPFASVAAVLVPHLEPDFDEISRAAHLPKLRGVLEQGQLGYLLRQILASSGSRGLLLVIDQFEELYTHCGSQAIRENFLNG